MPTEYINQTVHLRDAWEEALAGAGGFSESIDQEVHLRDELSRSIDSVNQFTQLINQEVHLRESWDKIVAGAGGFTQNINQTVHLREAWSRVIGLAGFVEFINDEVHLREEMTNVTVGASIVFGYNNNITFGETKDTKYKEYSHRFRWTNFNGVAVPDLNYKDLSEPIIASIPAPSFLQFKYDNSFLLFTRNTINRFVLSPDVEPGQWRAKTDNMIEEFKDLGLMEAKTLVLANDTLFGLSEKGVWKWNKDGMRLISKDIIDIPDSAGYEYVGFYNAIRNQYILHRQEGTAILYQMVHGAPVKRWKPGFLWGAYGTAPYGFMIDDTRFCVMAWHDADEHYLTMGRIDPVILDVIDQEPYQLIGGQQSHGYSQCPILNNQGILYTGHYTATPRYLALATFNDDLSFSHAASKQVSSATFLVLVELSKYKFIHFWDAVSTKYVVGTVTLTSVTTQAQYSGWETNTVSKLKGYKVKDGVAFIMYEMLGNIYARLVSDNGDGTLTFGSRIDTGLTNNANDKIEIDVVTSSRIFTVISNGTDLVLIPFSVSMSNVLTMGTHTVYSGWVDTASDIKNIALAPKGSSGFWLWFEDDRNSGYLTCYWGAGGDTLMELVEDVYEVVNSDESYSLYAFRVPGGQALLHYVDGSTYNNDNFMQVWGLLYANIDSYVYHIDRDKWMKFLGLDIQDVPVILSGGTLRDNYNLWIDSDREINKYPGTDSYTSVDAWIVTKDFYIKKGVFQRWLVDFEGVDVSVETNVRRVVSDSDIVVTDTKDNITPNELRQITLSQSRGRNMYIKITNPDIIKSLLFDIKEWGEK